MCFVWLIWYLKTNFQGYTIKGHLVKVAIEELVENSGIIYVRKRLGKKQDE